MQVSEELAKREKASDAVRQKIEADVNKERLKKANAMLHKLSRADSLIDELVHHTIKIAGMAPHAPNP